jgi:hypothetical protein
MSIGISNSVLNQKNAPAIYEDIFANRPAAGFSGRIFISTDTSQIFVDNGSSWVLIANTGIGSTGNLQVVTTNGNTTNAGIVINSGGLSTNTAQITALNQAGGVLFTDGSGNLAQDVNFNWDATNNYLGIGQTGTPTAPLDIHNGSVGVQIQLNATSTNNSTIAFQNANIGKWRVGNLYSAGSNLFHIYNNTAANNALTIDASNASTFIGSVTATSHITSGGTSGQFVKGNGTLDSTAYISLTSLSGTSPLQYNNTTGAFSILLAGASQSGYLSSTDWNTFNSKASLSAFSATTPLSYNSGTGAFSIQVANTGQSGYLSNTDWNTFNGKQSALSFGNLTETSSSVLTIAGGTGAVIGSGTTIAVKQSSATQNGYLSSTDWTTFNNKQTALSNPITGTGTTNYLPKFSGTTSLTNSIIFDNGSNGVGIGTSLPNLTAVGRTTLDINGSSTSLISLSAGGTNKAFIYNDGTNLQFTLNNTTSAVMSFTNSNGTAMSITTNGYIGMGTTNPTSPLMVFTSNQSTSIGNYFTNSVANFTGASTSIGLVIGNEGNVNRPYIQSGNNGTAYQLLLNPYGGNVGIGTYNVSGISTNYGTLNINGSNGGGIICKVNDTARGYFYSEGSGTYIIESQSLPIYMYTGGSQRLQVTGGGQLLVNGATTSNGQGALQNTGQSFTGGLGIGGLTFSTNTTASVNTSFYFFNGGAGVTLTLPDTNGQSMIYYIKNYSASPLTIGRTGSNTFVAAGTITTITSLTLATGVSTTIIGNGTSNYIQIQ